MLSFSSQTAPPLVIQLQESAMDPSAKVSNLLAKAKVAASKLRLDQISDWVKLETNGYGDQPVPDYRVISAVPKLLNPINGLIPILSDDARFMEVLNVARTGQSISELESLDKDSSYLRIMFPPKLQAFVQANVNLPIPMQGMWLIGVNQIHGIINLVRQRVLDWALELENAGVLGEGLTFSATERAAAMGTTNNFHGSNIGVLGNVSGQARVSNSQHANSSAPSKNDLRDFVEQVRSSQSLLPDSIQEEVGQSLLILDEQISGGATDAPKTVGALKSIRVICEGAAGNLVASGVIGLVAKLIGG